MSGCRPTLVHMLLTVTGPVFHWRGPSPFHFVRTDEEISAQIEAVSGLVSYGWGCIPVTARVGRTTWTTSLFPKDGDYLVPLRDAIRRAEGIDLHDVVTIDLDIDV